MKVVTLAGTPYEMGLQYGEQCRKEIKTFLRFIYFMATRYSMPDMESGNPRFWYILPTLLRFWTAKKRFRSLTRKHEEWIKKYSSDGLEQIKGIAEGAEVSYEDVLTLNVMTAYTFGLHHCSAWSALGTATKTGEPLLGMHSDEEKMVSKYEIVLQVEPDNGYKYVATALPGMLALGGAMNEKGLAIGAPFLLYVRSGGDLFDQMPLLVLFRAISECASIDEVLELYETLPNPSGSISVNLVDKNKAPQIEFSRKERDINVITDGILYSCNMAVSERIRKYDKIYEMKETYNAFTRTKRIGELTEQLYGGIDVEVMKAIARDHGEGETKGKSICQHGNSYSTIGSVIAQPRDLRMWISVGAPPCTQEYREFAF